MRTYIVCAIAVSLMMTGTAIAQEAQRGAQGREVQRAPLGQDGQRDRQPGQPGQPGQLGQQERIEHEARRAQIGQPGQQADDQLETHIASVMLLANKAQVDLNEHVKGKLEDDKVKEFAQKMIQEHQKCAEELKELAPHAASADFKADSDRDDRARQQPGQPGQQPGQPGQQLGQRPGQQPGITAGQTDQLSQQLLDIERRSFEEAVSMIKSEFDDMDGKQLDKAYLSQQIGAHIAMCARLSAVEGHVSGEMNEMVQETKEKVKSHLEKAKELLKEREDS